VLMLFHAYRLRDQLIIDPKRLSCDHRGTSA
jgi:hypothetical protein